MPDFVPLISLRPIKRGVWRKMIRTWELKNKMIKFIPLILLKITYFLRETKRKLVICFTNYMRNIKNVNLISTVKNTVFLLVAQSKRSKARK